MVKKASLDATIRSQAMARLKPAPAAGPFTAPSTGMPRRTSLETNAWRSTVIRSANSGTASPASTKPLTSPPEQNALPVPVIIKAR